MKRFLSTFFITLALVVGAASAAPAAHAQEGDMGGTNSVTGTNEATPGTTAAGCLEDPGDPGVFYDAETGEICTGAAKSALSTGDPAAEKTSKTYDAPPTTPEASLNGIMAWIASLFAWLAGVAMITLNYAVYFTVVTMGAYVNDLSAIGVTWQIMRDIGNIVIIFGFLVAGIATIIKYDMYGWGRTMLPKLLIAAVFINFSLFLTEAIIDTGNLFATQFYTQINGGKLPTSATLGSQGVSDKIMSQLGLTTIYGQVKDSKNSALYKENPMFIGFMSIILFIILAFVLFSLAFILIARFVILLFLIIIAPIGFAGLAVPKLESTAKLWWHNLFEQTITAPVLLLLLYIALAIITDANFLTSGGKPPEWLGLFGKDGATNIAGFATAILSFLVAMGLLLAVVKMSKSLSAFGGDMATKWAGRLSFGATALGASALLNSTAYGMRKGLQRYAPNSRAARVASRGLRFAEGMRMDVRSIPGVGAGLALGGAGDAAKPVEKSAGGRVRQAGDWWKKSSQESDRQYQQETVMPRLNAAIQASLQTGDYRQVSNILSSMSDKDFETGATQRALVNNPIAAALLPQARFEKIQQSEAISEARKAEIATARRNGDDPAHAQSRFNMDPTNVYGPTLPSGAPHPFAGMTRGEALISTMNTTARGRLGGNVLTENTAPAGAPPVYVPRHATLDLLNGSDFDAIRRTGELTPAHRTAVGEYILDVITRPHPPGAVIPPREASIAAAAATPAMRAYYDIP